jgi:hypothetical protein
MPRSSHMTKNHTWASESWWCRIEAWVSNSVCEDPDGHRAEAVIDGCQESKNEHNSEQEDDDDDEFDVRSPGI